VKTEVKLKKGTHRTKQTLSSPDKNGRKIITADQLVDYNLLVGIIRL